MIIRKVGEAFDAVMGLVEMARSFDAVMGVAQNLEAEARLLRERIALLEADLDAARAALEKTLGRLRAIEDRLRVEEAHTHRLAGERDEARARAKQLELAAEALNRRLHGE